MAKKTKKTTETKDIKRVMDYEDVKSWENRVEEIRKEYSKYGNVPVPAKYKTKKLKGVAAFDTLPEAEALAQELTELIHYQHIVEVDSELGCAVVIITDKLFIPIEDSNVTMGVLQKNWKDFFDPAALGICGFAFSADGDVKVGGNDVIFLQEIPLQSLEAVEKCTLEYLQKYTRDRAYKLNASVLMDYKINKALIMIYGTNGLCDAFGEEIDCGETLYKYNNSTVSISKISLEEKTIYANGTTDKMVLSYYWAAEVTDANGNPVNLSECKKSLWSSKERKKKNLLTYEDRRKADEKKEKREICIKILVPVLIFGLVAALVCYCLGQSEIVNEREIDVTVTKGSSLAGYSILDVGDFCLDIPEYETYYVLTDSKGKSMTFNSNGANLPKEGKITVTLSKMKCGETIVSYNGVKLIRIS